MSPFSRSLLALILVLGHAAAAQNRNEPKQFVVSNDGGAALMLSTPNFRSVSDTSKHLALVPHNTVVRVFERKKDPSLRVFTWARIEVLAGLHKGKTGWVSGRAVKPRPASVPKARLTRRSTARVRGGQPPINSGLPPERDGVVMSATTLLPAPSIRQAARHLGQVPLKTELRLIDPNPTIDNFGLRFQWLKVRVLKGPLKDKQGWILAHQVHVVPTPPKKVRIKFDGSFQCRLATDGDPTNHKPTDPMGRYGTRSIGWTFAFREPSFDRIIRLSRPVTLRNAQIDAWKDTAVRAIELEFDTGRRNLTSDPLINKVVSIGTISKFQGRITYETIPGFKFSIGTDLLQGTPVGNAQMDGARLKRNTAHQNNYRSVKPTLVSRASGMDPLRKAGMTAQRVNSLSVFYSFSVPMKKLELRVAPLSSRIPAGSGLDRIDDVNRYKWELTMTLGRYDGDTLTGRVEKGELLGTRMP